MSVNAWAKRQGEVYLTGTSSIGITLAELREFISQADTIGIEDSARVFVSGLCESATYKGVYHFNKASVRSPVEDE